MRAADYRTPVKTRILAGGVHSAKQQVVRIDREAGWPLMADVGGTFVRKLGPALADCDAVVLSDYGSGLVTPALASAIRARLATRARRRPVPVLLDSRYRLLDYRALTICTPNESEVEQALDLRIDDDPEALERAGREILKRTRMRGVLITRGSRGMALFEHKPPTVHVPIFGSDEIADVTGAGDTVWTRTALVTARLLQAALLANYAGGSSCEAGMATSGRELGAGRGDHDIAQNWSQEGPAPEEEVSP